MIKHAFHLNTKIDHLHIIDPSPAASGRLGSLLVVFGYSCPDADQAARNMIKHAFHLNTKIDHLHIIDPSPAASGRLGSLLRAPVVTRYTSVGDFVGHYEPS